MAIELTESAAKRGYTEQDVVHAIGNAYVDVADFEESRVPGRGAPHLWLGPSRDALNPVVELLAEEVPPRTLRVFHMMPIRQHFREQFAQYLPEEHR